MSYNSTTTINQSKLIIVEGKDDHLFFNELCKYLDINDYQIIDHDGITKYRNKLKAIIDTTGFRSNVTSLGIIRDADSDANSTFQSVQDALRYCNLPVPPRPLIPILGTANNPKINILILPPNNTHGILEDVLLTSIQNDPVTPCVDQYFLCVARARVRNSLPIHLSKAKIQVFLASRRECWLSLGVAAQQNYWTFTDVAFNDLRNFLLSL